MSFIQRLVSPKLPTALATHSHVELPGNDLLLTNVYTHTLRDSFGVMVGVGLWVALLDAVPVEIDYKLEASCDSLLNGDSAVQNDIPPFLNRQPIGTDLVNCCAPLLRLKLAFFNDATTIGVSWNHTLGDATVLSRFMHTLSQFYQGLPPEHPALTFKKHHFPAPPGSITDQSLPRMPQLNYSRLFAEHDEIFSEIYKNVEHLKWRFDSHDLAELRSTLSGQKGCISTQDCLTTYLVAILNYNRSIHVRNVVNISSCRNIGASFVDENVVSNLAQSVLATVPTDMAGIVAALRHALIQCREPDYIYNWMSALNSYMLEATNAGKSPFLTFPDGTVHVNSNIVIGWCSAHFGCPDGPRFHTGGVFELYLRCFRCNPTKGDDGV